MKNLVRLNFILAVLLSTLIYIFLIAITHDSNGSILRFIQGFVFISCTGLANLMLRHLLLRNQETALGTRIIFFSSSYLSSVLVWFFVRFLHSVISGHKWEGDGEHIMQAYFLAILAVIIFNTLILLLQNMVILQHKKVKGEMENLQLRANASEITNLLLRQQIHPHFLFNALNTTKSLYKKDIKEGEAYLVHLANFLRVSISNQTSKTVLVKQELEFCMDYLKMQKIRFGSALDYKISISEATINKGYLPYFSLQPLVENALKHNDLTEERPIRISIDEDEGRLIISNNLQPKRYKEPSTGIGLSNLSERYRLLTGEGITIQSEEQNFRVIINILSK